MAIHARLSCLVTVLLLGGCELIVDFDRSKIDAGAVGDAAMDAADTGADGRVDAGADGGDAAVPDGGDAGLDGDLPDGAMPDGDLPDGGDGGADGGMCDGVDCSGMDDACNLGVCNPTTGACTKTPRMNGTACNDGDACTVADECTDGTCAGSAVDCSGMNDSCNLGVCNATTGACMAAPRMNGTACDDGDLCTTGDQCTGGTCAGSARDCSSLDNQCNLGVCNATTGACQPMPRTNGTACSDGNLCTTGDTCTGGSCAGDPVDCSGSANQCNTAACSAATGACVLTPVMNGTACNDGNLCTITDVCTAGSCAGTMRDCSSETDQCNTGVCNPTTGACQGDPVMNGLGCNDGNQCTTADACTDGTCAGTALMDGAACTDGFFCTHPDTCQAGVCDPGSPRTCSDGNTCTVDVCNEGADSCANVSVSQAILYVGFETGVAQDQVRLWNVASTVPISLGAYEVCSGATCASLSGVTIAASGAVTRGLGAIDVNTAAGELALRVSGGGAICDYVQWGAGSQTLASDAVTDGAWSALGDFVDVTGLVSGEVLQWDPGMSASNDTPTAWSDGPAP